MVEIWNQYWWLIFPLLWFAWMMVRTWLQHRTRREALDVVRAYAAQGRDPPAEVLKILEVRPDAGFPRRDRTIGLWHRVVIFASISIGFGVLAYSNPAGSDARGTFFIAVLMGVMALGHLAIALLKPKPNGQ